MKQGSETNDGQAPYGIWMSDEQARHAQVIEIKQEECRECGGNDGWRKCFKCDGTGKILQVKIGPVGGKLLIACTWRGVERDVTLVDDGEGGVEGWVTPHVVFSGRPGEWWADAELKDQDGELIDEFDPAEGPFRTVDEALANLERSIQEGVANLQRMLT